MSVSHDASIVKIHALTETTKVEFMIFIIIAALAILEYITNEHQQPMRNE
jgi:hypothetical protein